MSKRILLPPVIRSPLGLLGLALAFGAGCASEFNSVQQADVAPGNFWRDADGDGYGDPEDGVDDATAGYVSNHDDCDDADPAVNPDAIEVCDGIDNDCDGTGGLSGENTLADADGGLTGGAGDLGYAVALTGDVNGDGLADLVVGSPLDDSGANNAGAVYVAFGTSDPAALDIASADLTLVGQNGGDNAGHAVATCDVNGDAIDDIIVGAPNNDGGGANAGAVYVVLGGGGLGGTIDLDLADWKLNGTADDQLAGWDVACLGDVSGDGNEDLVIGAPRYSSPSFRAGAAFVYNGSSAPVGTDTLASAAATLEGTASREQAGLSVSGAGDVNGDLIPDVLVGAPRNSSSATQAGAVYVVHGPVSGTVSLGSADAILTGAAAYDRAGQSVSSGDFNGDNLSDLLIGAPRNDASDFDSGAALVVYAPFSGGSLATAAGGILQGVSRFDEAGWKVAGVRDINGDGNDDMLVGAYGNDAAGSNAGAAYLAYGPVYGELLLSSAAVTLTGVNAGAEAGWAVSGGADADGDGNPDLAVGAPQDGGGVAYLVGGGSDGIDNNAADEINFFADTDGDGYGDDSLTTLGCSPAPTGFAEVGGDCDDTDDTINPGATDLCDGVDRNCDGENTAGIDGDGDGYFDVSCGGLDCDDTEASIFPNPAEEHSGWLRPECNVIVYSDQIGTFSWNDGRVEQPNVVWDGVQWRMYYRAHRWRDLNAIGMATSPDGVTWTEYETNPVVPQTAAPTWAKNNDENLSSPSVVYDPSDAVNPWKMYFHARIDDGDRVVGLMVSADGIAWTNYDEASGPLLGTTADSSAYDSRNVHNPHVFADGGTWYMYYSAKRESDDEFSIALASSSDGGYTWTKDAANPLFFGGGGRVASPSVLEVDGFFDLVFAESSDSDFDDLTYSRLADYDMVLDEVTRAFEPNTALSLAGGFAWDGGTITGGQIVNASGDSYYLYYGGDNGTRSFIGYAQNNRPSIGVRNIGGSAGEINVDLNIDDDFPKTTEVFVYSDIDGLLGSGTPFNRFGRVILNVAASSGTHEVTTVVFDRGGLWREVVRTVVVP